MKNRSRTAAYLSAAVTALLLGGTSVHARDLTFDDTTLADDGSGTGAKYSWWDTSHANWFDGTGDVTWSNSPADSAILGNTTNAFNAATKINQIVIAGAVTVQNLTFGVAANGGNYLVYSDPEVGSTAPLTLLGNVTKTSVNGNPQFQLLTGLALGAGDHTFTANDTPGDAAPELLVESAISGAGNVIIDNGASYASWGTTAFTLANSYTGTTTITKGRLIITNSNALGSTSGGTIIGNMGTLSIGGSGKAVTSGLNIAEPITITRNTYTGGDANDGNTYAHYPAAIISTNGTGIHTFSGPFVIDSTDARVQANTSTINIASNITQGPDVTAGVLTLDGDFAGFVTLSGNNTAFAGAGGAIRIINGVELNASSEANLGGATSKLILNGGTIHATGALASSSFMTNFGTHDLSGAPINTGVDLDAGQTFTVNGLTGIAIGMRGGGTLNFQGTNTFSGTPFFDGFTAGQTPTGIVNFAAGSSTSQKGLRLRSPQVNIAGTLNVGGSYTSIGVDSGGTNGGPDKATVNITGNGALIENTGDDFNVSDNASTQGTINMSGSATLTTGGVTYLGKNNGATGTINQSGGTFTINRSGNFGFVIADGRSSHTPTGTYNLSGGTFKSDHGEIYVGEGGGSGTNWGGTWNQTGGTATFGTWFVIGREGAIGTLNLSGGSLSKSGTDGGSNFSIGEASSNVCTMNVSLTGTFAQAFGQFWVGNSVSGAGTGVLNVGTAAGAATNADATASVTVSDWFAVGRGGGTSGTVNLYDGTITQNTKNWFTIGSGGTGTVNVNGGTLNVLQAYIGETGSSTGTLNINGGNVNFTNNSVFSNAGSVKGNLNLNGGTLTAFGFTAQNGGGTGKSTFTFNGGVLRASTDNTNFIGGKVTSVVSTGGAKIDVNGHNITINSALTHDSTLAGADGGLTKNGTGNLTLTGASTYTGKTVLNGSGTVTLASTAFSPVLTATPGGASLSSATRLVFNYGTAASPASSLFTILKASHDSGAFRDSTQRIYTTAAADSTHGLGYADDGANVTVAYTWYGDANVDGKVNADDYALIDRGYARNLTNTGWFTGDFNYDGRVDSADYLLIDTSFGQINGGLSPEFIASREAQFGDAYVSQLIAAVPEPTSLGLVGLGAVAAFGRRRRNA